MTDDVRHVTLCSAIREGESHVRRMQRATALLSPHFPVTAASLTTLPDDVVPLLDQFIYRFSKLHHSMAHRLLPTLYAYLQADDSPKPFLDILSYLEKVGALTSEEEWQFFRGLRNNLAHDYPETADQNAQTLNALFSRWGDLATMFAAARDYYLNTVANRGKNEPDTDR